MMVERRSSGLKNAQTVTNQSSGGCCCETRDNPITTGNRQIYLVEILH